MYIDTSPNARRHILRLPESESLTWASDIPEQSTATSRGELTYPAYNRILVTYLVCERDKVLSQGIEHGMVEMVAKKSGRDGDA